MAGGGKRVGAGRKPGSLNKVTRDIRAIALKFSDAAIKRLAHLAENAESEAVQVAASKELLDRAFGRSMQRTEGSLEVSTHDGARDKLRTKLDRISSPGSEGKSAKEPH